MTPVTHRGRRRLEPDQPVERLRGLLDEDLAAAGHELPAEDRTAASQDAAQEEPWVSPIRARVPWFTLLIAAAVVAAVVLSFVLRDRSGEAVVASAPSTASAGSTVAGDPPAEDADPSAGVSLGPGQGPAQGLDQGPVTVHVVGEVERPGVVELPDGGRIADAVEAAGGLSDDAVIDAVNMAAPAADGTQIVIPDQELADRWEQSPPAGAADGAAAGTGASAAGGSTAGGPAAGAAGTGVAGSAAGGSTAGAGAAGRAEEPGGAAAGGAAIDLNSATAAQLEELPKVGPVLAQRIIEHREQIGGFRTVEELDGVSGIGPAMMEAIAPLVTV